MKKTTNREEWLKERKKGIGASEASCIIGVNSWKTNVELWQEKTGQREAEDIGDKDCVMYGKKAEELVRGLFELDYPGYKVEYDEFGMIANRPNEPWLFATLDGHIIGGNKNGVLEIKTTTISNQANGSIGTDKYLIITTRKFCINFLQQDTISQYYEPIFVITKVQSYAIL